MSSIWKSFIYTPLYNLLIAVVAIVPGHSVGVAVIIITLVVKLALLPMTIKASKAQRAMKELEPELKALREKHADDKQQLALKTMTLYQERNVSPFSGCLPLLVQLPFIIALYLLIQKGITINPDFLYSFTPRPEMLDMHFLGINLASKSIILALIAGVTQYLQTKYVIPKMNLKEQFAPTKEGGSMQEEFARSMNLQMLYMFPVLIGFISYSASAAVALYFVVSNIVGIGQEYFLRRAKIKK